MSSSINNLPTNHLIDRYLSLIEVSRNLSSTLDLDTLLKNIVTAAAEVTYTHAASILLYDEGKNELYFQVSTNIDSPLMRGLVVPVESSIAGEIVTKRKPIVVMDVKSNPRHFDRVGKELDIQTQSLLGVPLIAKDKVIGVLEVINKIDGDFTQEDEELLGALGSQAAIAIENARLFQQSDLVSEMVHELRTPLASINTAAFLLKRPEISPDQRTQIAETIQSEAGRLSEMVSSFLWSRETQINCCRWVLTWSAMPSSTTAPTARSRLAPKLTRIRCTSTWPIPGWVCCRSTLNPCSPASTASPVRRMSPRAPALG
jgi:signal transduction protein with GAF and PtsI domain